jgi:hypothetical protein
MSDSGCSHMRMVWLSADVATIMKLSTMSYLFYEELLPRPLLLISLDTAAHRCSFSNLVPGNAQRQEKEVSKAVGAIEHWLPRFDVVVIGPGLGRDAWVHATVTQVSLR